MIKILGSYASRIAICASLAVGGSAYAQDAGAGAAAEASVYDAGGFGDIIVTARKRDERLQDVPVAISAFNQADLNRYATGSLAQLSTQAPQLIGGLSSNTDAGSNIVLRGVGSPATGPAVDQAVSFNIDGVQISKGYAIRLGIYDLERVEILKGPQALFFGKNSPGGVISVISADPGDKLEIKVRAGYEFTAHKKYIEGVVSSPLTETLGVRLDGYVAESRGWFINEAPPVGPQPIPASLGGGFTTASPGGSSRHGPKENDYFVRGTVKFEPSDAFDAKLKLSYTRYDQEGGLGFGNQLFACPAGGPFYATILGWEGSRNCKLDRRTSASNFGAGYGAGRPNNVDYNDGELFVRNRQFLGSLTMNYHFTDEITLTSVTGYWDLKNSYLGNFSFGSQAYLSGNYGLHDKQFTQEVRLSTDFDKPINLVMGGFYQDEKLSSAGWSGTDSLYTSLFTGFAVPPSPQILAAPVFSQKTKAWSVFGQVLADITDQLQLAVGARYSHEEKRVQSRVLPKVFAPAGYDVILTPNKRSWNNFSPEITLTYKPVQNITLYGSYRHGFKSGGFDLSSSTGIAGPNAGDISYEQEKVKGGEIGLKGSFFDRQVTLDLSAYNFKYSGLQVAAFEPATVSYKVTNAASAKVRGIEMALKGRPRALPGLELRTAIAYNKATYGNFQSSPCYTGQSQAQGCNLITSAGPGGSLLIVPAGPTTIGNAQDLTGRTLHRAPRWAANVGGTYDYELANGWSLNLAADGIYTSSYQAMAEQDPRAKVSGFWRLNASIGIHTADDRWALALIGTNLTQKLKALNALSYAATGSGTGAVVSTPADLQADVTEPRTVALQLTFKY